MSRTYFDDDGISQEEWFYVKMELHAQHLEILSLDKEDYPLHKAVYNGKLIAIRRILAYER